MLIVSDFHDYYDVCMKMGVDKTIVYQRNTKHLMGEEFPVIDRYSSDTWHPAVLAICGKFYPFVYHVPKNSLVMDRIVWSLEEASGCVPMSGFAWDKERIDTEQGLRTFFTRKWAAMENVFYDRKTPVFAFEPLLGRQYTWKKRDYESLVLNPCLKSLEFYKVRDPYSLFQDIQGYISGVIGIDTKPTIEISDEDKAEAKGHGGKYSFRKPPGGKRGKPRWR